MDIKEIKSERVAEKYYKINHPSGLTIYVYPKPTAANLDDCESVLKLAKVLSDYIAGGNLAKGKTV